jgi:hypothetical protein
MPVEKQCFVIGNKLDDSAVKTSEILLKKQSFDYIMDDLGIDFSINGAYKFLKLGHIKYISSIKDTQHTISYLFYYKHAFSTKVMEYNNVIGEDILNDEGKSLYKKQPEKFIEKCGDSVVTKIQESAVFIANVKIMFKSQESKKDFTTKINLIDDSSIMSVMSGITGTQTLASIELSAFQAGGSPSELSKILSFDQEKHYHIISCSPKNVESCRNAVDGILQYLQEFSKQIATNDFGGLVTRVDTEKLDNFLPNIIPNVIYEDTKKSREDLNKKYDDLCNYRDTLEKVIDSDNIKNHIHRDDYKKLEAISKKIKTIIQKLEDEAGAIVCFRYPKDCDKITKEFDSEIQTLDYKYIDHFTKVVNFSANLNTWNPFLWHSKVIAIMWPYTNGEQYLFGHNEVPDTYVVKSQDIFIINSTNACPELSKSGNAKYSKKFEDTTHCFGNWWDTYCNNQYISCAGEIIVQEVDILDYI